MFVKRKALNDNWNIVRAFMHFGSSKAIPSIRNDFEAMSSKAYDRWRQCATFMFLR